MHDYELTDRGKIVVAVLIAVILLALAVALTVKAFANQEPQSANGTPSSTASDPVNSPPVEPPTTGISIEEPGEPPEGTPGKPPEGTPDKPPEGTPDKPPGETPDETPPTTTNSPPPSGGGFNPPAVPSPTASSSPDVSDPPDGHDLIDPPISGPTGGTPSEGTLSFLFSPAYQDELDSATASLLGDLLRSPNNTRNSSIAVATPRLSHNDSTTLMAAVSSAFSVYGITEQRILHIENSTGTAGETFEVSFYFIPSAGK